MIQQPELSLSLFGSGGFVIPKAPQPGSYLYVLIKEVNGYFHLCLLEESVFVIEGHDLSFRNTLARLVRTTSVRFTGVLAQSKNELYFIGISAKFNLPCD